MDIVLAITTKDTVIVATSKARVQGITVQNAHDDKTLVFQKHTLAAFSGESGDTVQLAEYLQANVQLHDMRHGFAMSPKAVASFTRSTLAESLRSRKPYNVNLVLASVDPKTGEPSLTWIDYLASSVSLPYAAHGYAAYYVMSLLDRHHRPGLTEAEGLELMGRCIEELKLRLPIQFKGVQIRIVDAQGVRPGADIV